MAIDQHSEEHFKIFSKTLARTISRYDVPESELLERQRIQVETLVALETEFRKTLIRHSLGNEVYKGFVHFICHERRNILAARPFFRERHRVFTEQISDVLKKEHERGLYKFHFNYGFVRFVMNFRKWPKNSRLMKLARKIEDSRKELIEMNMPLAISRARIFYSRTPKSHLDYMDFVQIAAEGLIAAVDKFVLPFSSVFRAVAIGRMVGYFIEQYSETLIHFYPVDKRKIYRANKVTSKLNQNGDTVDFQKIADEVNKGVEEKNKTNAEEIAELLAAVSCSSTDVAETADVQRSPKRWEARELGYPASKPFDSALEEDQQPDRQVEKSNALYAMKNAISILAPIEQKLLRLHGVGVDSL